MNAKQLSALSEEVETLRNTSGPDTVQTLVRQAESDMEDLVRLHGARITSYTMTLSDQHMRYLARHVANRLESMGYEVTIRAPDERRLGALVISW